MKKPNSLLDELRNFASTLPEWLDQKALGLVGLLLIMVVAMSWSEPLPAQKLRSAALAQVNASATAQVSTPQATLTVAPDATPTEIAPTPIPEEWANNREMGTGIVMGAVALVLIIVGGTLSAIRRK